MKMNIKFRKSISTLVSSILIISVLIFSAITVSAATATWADATPASGFIQNSSNPTAMIKLVVSAGSIPATPITFINISFAGAGFDTTDLLALDTTQPSGIMIWKDNGDGSFSSASDTFITLQSIDDLSGAGPYYTNISVTSGGNSYIPNTFFVVIRTSATISDGDVINATVTYLACTDGEITISGTPQAELTADTVRPTLDSIVWHDTDGSTNITATDYLVFTFSEDMDTSTVTSGNIDTRLPLSNGHTYGTSPTVNWTSSSVLNVTLGAGVDIVDNDSVNPTADVKDEAGLADNTTSAPLIQDDVAPTVSSVDLSTLYDAQVGNVTVNITFSEPMNTSVNATVSLTGLDSSPYSFTSQGWTSSTVFKCNFTFVDDGENATGTLGISGAQDVGENNMVADNSNTVAVDTENPTLNSIVWHDTDGSTNITATDYLVFTFSENMDTSTVTSGNIDTRLPLSNGHTYGTSPTVNWTSSSVLNVTLGAGVDIVDNDSVNPTADVTDTWGNDDATSSAPLIQDDVAPTVSSVDLSTLYDAQVGNVTVNITFSEPMNTSVNPTVNMTGLTTDPYTFTAQGWTSSTVFKCNFTFVDDGEEDTGTVNILGGKDAAGNLMSADSSNTVNVDTDNPTGTISVDTNPIYESDLVQLVTITYNESMDAGSTPTITFSGNSSTITSAGAGSWSVGNTVWTQTFNVADENEETAVVWVSSSGATDANGNTEGTSTNTSFEIDTIKPTISSLTVSDSTLTDADASSTLWVNMTFAEAMNTSVNPTIAFDANIISYGTLSYDSGSWSGNTMFNASYTVADNNDSQTNVDVIVTVAQDVAGNILSSHTESDQIDVDTRNPWVTNIDVSDTLINETDAAGTFYVNVTFSEAMTTGSTPLFAFTADVADSGTLTYSDKTWGSTWVNASFTIADANEEQTNVDIAITNVTDSNSNSINTLSNSIADKFSVDTVKPTISSLVVSDSILSDSDVGSTFYVNVTFSESMSAGTNPTFTFDPDVVANGNLTNAGGSWASGTIYSATWTIADENQTVADIDIQVSGAKDVALNTMSANTSADKFTISTGNPTFDSAVAVGTNTINVTFSEWVTVVNADGSDFSATGATITAASASGAVVTLTTSNDLASDYTANDLAIAADAVRNNDTNGNILTTGQTISDGQAPSVIYAVFDTDYNGNSQTYIDVVFDENVANASIATSDFSLSVSGVTVSAIYNDGNTSEVTLKLSHKLTGGGPTITVAGNGVNDTSSNTLSSGTTTINTYRIDLASGWNLISIPASIDSYDVDVVLNSIWSNINMNLNMLYYNNTLDDWETYWPPTQNATPGFNHLYSGRAYWINMNSSATLIGNYSTISSGTTPFPVREISGHEWNMVGHWVTYNQTADVNGGLSSLDDVLASSGELLYKYDTTSGALVPIYASSTTNMEPGQGYWLYLKTSNSGYYTIGELV